MEEVEKAEEGRNEKTEEYLGKSNRQGGPARRRLHPLDRDLGFVVMDPQVRRGSTYMTLMVGC